MAIESPCHPGYIIRTPNAKAWKAIQPILAAAGRTFRECMQQQKQSLPAGQGNEASSSCQALLNQYHRLRNVMKLPAAGHSFLSSFRQEGKSGPDAFRKELHMNAAPVDAPGPFKEHWKTIKFKTSNGNPGHRAPRQKQGLEPRHLDVDMAKDAMSTLPIVLFDLNGTLTQHPSAKNGPGTSKVRPGTEHLRSLQSRFQLGVFSSASQRTVQQVVQMLEEAAGPGRKLFPNKNLILHRDHTKPASAEQVQRSQREYDTVKPLHMWFTHMHRVLLVDDDDYKGLDTEKENMIIIPCWDEQPEDQSIKHLVDTMLQVYTDVSAAVDVRTLSALVSTALQPSVTTGEGNTEL